MVIEFFNRLFDWFGLVEEILTNNGTLFTSIKLENYLKALGIRPGLAALYSPRLASKQAYSIKRHEETEK